MMKILFDVSVLNQYHSGIYFAARNILLQLLLRQDTEITLFTPEWCKKKEREALLAELPPGTRLNIIQSCFVRGLAIKGERWAARHQDNSAGAVRFLYRLIRMMSCLVKCCFPSPDTDGAGYDAYFSPVYHPPKRIEANPDIQKYVLLHDVTPILFPQFFSGPKIGWFQQLTELLSNKIGYFANSEATKQDFLRFFPGRVEDGNITVIPLGTHHNFSRQTDPEISRAVLEKYGIGDGQKYFFSLCSIEPRKNLLHSVECFVKLIESQKDKNLLFVLGGAPYDKGDPTQKQIRKDLLEIAEKYPQVRMIGYVPDEDLATLYSNAECFVYCSLYEGFGLPILEAMLCGCPVICSNISSMPEVAGDAALLVDPAQKEQLVGTMKQVHQDAALREKMREAGLAQASKFSYKKAAEVIVQRMTADSVRKNA